MGRGEYGRIVSGDTRGDYRRAYIGAATVYHSVSDRDRAVEQINTEFAVFVADVMRSIGVNGADLDLMFDPTFLTDKVKQARFGVARGMLMASPYYSLWRDVISPVYEEFKRFYHDQSTWNQFVSSYDDYERWMQRLQQLRDAVDAQNIKLRSPTPIPLPRTVWQEAGGVAHDAAQTVVNTAADLGKVLKVALIGVVAIGGAIALGTLAVDVKKGRAPADRYAGLAKGLVRVAR